MNSHKIQKNLPCIVLAINRVTFCPGWTVSWYIKDLGHFWLGYIRMLGHLQSSAHLPNFEMLQNHFHWFDLLVRDHSLSESKGVGLSLTCYKCFLDIGTMTIESVPHPFLQKYWCVLWVIMQGVIHHNVYKSASWHILLCQNATQQIMTMTVHYMTKNRITTFLSLEL